jgi:hypothetical protein
MLQKTMMELAKSGVSDLSENNFKDSLRAMGQSKIVIFSQHLIL